MKKNLSFGLVILFIFILGGFYFYFINPNRQNGKIPLQPPTETGPVQPGSKAGFEKTGCEQDFKLANISLYSDPDQIIKLQGEPVKREKINEPSFHNPAYTTYYETWVYDDLNVIFVNNAENQQPDPGPGKVMAIKVKSHGYPTFRGIQVGDSLDKVFKIYGRAELEDNLYTYYVDLNYIAFEVEDGKISSIQVGFLFD